MVDEVLREKPNADSFRRQCVFCGEIPTKGNNEHPIPQWLIKRTGDLNRDATFVAAGYGKQIKHAFSKYKMPACAECNARYQILEHRALEIFEKLWNDQDLVIYDFEALFDWCDKVRISTWRMQLARTGNYSGVSPKFFVDNNIGRFDGILWLLRTMPTGIDRLNLINDINIFPCLPNHMGLIANNIAIVMAAESRLADVFLSQLKWLQDNTLTGPRCLNMDLIVRNTFGGMIRSMKVANDPHAKMFVRPRLSQLVQANEGDVRGHYGLVEPVILEFDNQGSLRQLTRDEPIKILTPLLDDLDDLYLRATRLTFRVCKQMVEFAKEGTESEQFRRLLELANMLTDHFESHTKKSFIAEQKKLARTGQPLSLTKSTDTVQNSAGGPTT